MKGKLFICAILCILFATAGVFADIVIYRSGNYNETKIADVTDQHVVIQTEYGEQKLPRSQLAGWFQSELGKPGSDFFRAGEFMLKHNQRERATELFQKAVALDTAYREPAMNALAGTQGTATGTTPPVTTLGPRMITETLTCPICGGEGRRALDIQTAAGTTIKRIVTCYFCDGKGLAFRQRPEGTRVCPECNGWGYAPGKGRGSQSGTSGTGSTSGFGGTTGSTGTTTGGTGTGMRTESNVEYKQPCWRCNGQGYVGQPQMLDTALRNIDLVASADTAGSVGYSGAVNPGTTPTYPGSSHPGTGTSYPTGPSGTFMPPNPQIQPGTTVTPPAETTDTTTSDTETKDDSEEVEEPEKTWLQANMKLVLIAAGVVLLLIVLILSQSSKK